MSLVNSIAARFGTMLAVFAIALIVLTAPCVNAQLTIPEFPENPVELTPVPSPALSDSPVPEPVVPIAPVETHSVETQWTGPSPGYWIVSTWSSPQRFDDSPLMLCDEVNRFDECIGYRRSSLGELSQSLIPGVPVCIVVHGSFMDSPSVIPESCSTWQWLKAGSCGRPFQMIYFSWPSDRPISALASIDVAVLGKRAGRNGFYLASLIQHVPPECPVCLIGHSHGTRVISSSLHLMAGGAVEGCGHPFARAVGRRIRTVFAASAIDHDWLNPGQRYDRALCSTECLLNLRNGCDPALMIYPLRCIGSSRALGCSGFTAKDHKKLGSWNAKVKDMDVSDPIGARHLWPYYVRQVWLARSIGNYVYFSDLQMADVHHESRSQTH